MQHVLLGAITARHVVRQPPAQAGLRIAVDGALARRFVDPQVHVGLVGIPFQGDADIDIQQGGQFRRQDVSQVVLVVAQTFQFGDHVISLHQGNNLDTVIVAIPRLQYNLTEQAQGAAIGHRGRALAHRSRGQSGVGRGHKSQGQIARRLRLFRRQAGDTLVDGNGVVIGAVAQ